MEKKKGNEVKKTTKHKTSGRKVLMLLLLGGALGAIIGKQLETVQYLGWINSTKTFGLTKPLDLDLGVITTSVTVSFKLSASSVMGMLTTLGIWN